MNYFAYETLLTIHERVLSVSGGLPGVKDEGLLRSPIEIIQHDGYYPTLQDKMTHLVYSLIKNHGFNDGNKRSALASGAMLLMLNGYDGFIPYYFRIFEQVMVLVADNRLSKEQLGILMKDMVSYGTLTEASLMLIIDNLSDSSKTVASNE